MTYTLVMNINEDNKLTWADRSVFSPSGGLRASNRITLTGTTETDVDHRTGLNALANVEGVFIANRAGTDILQIGWATTVYDFELEPGRAIFVIRPLAADARFFVRCKTTAVDSKQVDYAMWEH
jgi:hypothetical protein